MQSSNSKINDPPAGRARAPIVAILGHVDHGKSTLLDYIRKTNIVAREAGGITQHISAYEAEHEGRKITFIDTPGHEAFPKIRARAAGAADIAILIVSAVEGAEPQTLEALEAIKTASIPYIVALNKIDRPEASLERAKQSLAEKQIYVEGYGGSVPALPISAKVGTGVPELLDLIILQADLLGLEGHPSSPAEGGVIESHLDPKRGNVATLIIRDGTLKRGTYIAVGKQVTKIKILENFAGHATTELGPSSPARVTGFDEVPDVGSSFKSFDNKGAAQEYVLTVDIKKEASNNTEKEVMIPVIILADVSGMVEAIRTMLPQIESEKVGFKIISSGTGKVTDSDIKTARGAQDPIVVAFNTDVERVAADAADQNDIKIQKFDVIYKLKEWLEGEVVSRAPKIEVEEIVGRAKVVKLFNQERDRQVVGGQVTEGKLAQGAQVRVKRRDNEITTGKIIELQQNKNKVKEIEAGNMFGLLVECKLPIAAGDVVEAYELQTR